MGLQVCQFCSLLSKLFFLLEATNESMSSTFRTFILYRMNLIIVSQCSTSLWGQPLLHWGTCKSAVFPSIGYRIGYIILCIQIPATPHERYDFRLALSTKIMTLNVKIFKVNQKYTRSMLINVHCGCLPQK